MAIPELQDIGALRRVLPFGRYLATMDELRARYVPDNDDNRRAIWEAFCEVTGEVRQVYGKVAAAWLGGSFITSEEHPHDIDVVFLVDEHSYTYGCATNVGRFVTQILLRKHPGVSRLNPLVDAYLFPVPPTQIEYDYNYCVARGYWDQFWSKARFVDGDERWLYPAAGYLEVVIDGYNT